MGAPAAVPGPELRVHPQSTFGPEHAVRSGGDEEGTASCPRRTLTSREKAQRALPPGPLPARSFLAREGEPDSRLLWDSASPGCRFPVRIARILTRRPESAASEMLSAGPSAILSVSESNLPETTASQRTSRPCTDPAANRGALMLLFCSSNPFSWVLSGAAEAQAPSVDLLGLPGLPSVETYRIRGEATIWAPRASNSGK